jgi:hypothetical protein
VTNFYQIVYWCQVQDDRRRSSWPLFSFVWMGLEAGSCQIRRMNNQSSRPGGGGGTGRGAPKSVSCEKTLRGVPVQFESPALWFTNVELHRRHNIEGHPDIPTSFLYGVLSTCFEFDIHKSPPG